MSPSDDVLKATARPSSRTLAKWVLKASSRSEGFRLPFGRLPDWFKMKNPTCAAVTREAEEF
jgi:hypothetical protein